MDSPKVRARKATWLAFGLVTLAGLSSCATEPATTSVSSTQTGSDQASEAARAYKHAVTTLATLTAHPPTYSQESSFMSAQHSSHNNPLSSFLSSLIPKFEPQGRLGSIVRVFVKLQHHSWIKPVLNGIGKGKQGLGLGASKRKDEEMRGNAIKVIDLLTHAADLGYSDALYTLAQLSLFPPNSYFPSDPDLAYQSFASHASTTGNATSQGYLAFFHSTGYHQIVPVDQAKAQLYYTFAAHGGNKGAQMALGYRSWFGIGTLENCARSMAWYESASEMAMAKFLSGPPGGRTLPQTPTRLSDLDGGAYGPGASVASTGPNIYRPAVKAGLARAAGETWEDVLEYYFFNAERKEIDFEYRLGKIFYQGSIYASPGGIASGSEGVSSIPRDYERARRYFMSIARQVWPHDTAKTSESIKTDDTDSQVRLSYASASAGYLARMYLRGEGVKQDHSLAKLWFQRGADNGDRESHNGLGIMWRDGLVPEKQKNVKLALGHFEAASKGESPLAEALVNLGKHHYEKSEVKTAMMYFESAMRHGSPFEAYYYLAEMQASQSAIPGLPEQVASSSCSIAVSFHKMVAERGVWGDDLLNDAEIAWNSGTDRGKEMAMLKWWIGAERGYEIAQTNLAYVLDQDKSLLRLTRFSPVTPSNDTARLALTQWTRAAAQRNIDALVKVGDYYYHGLGVSDEPDTVRFEKAAKYYQSAADTHQSALAMWNLGWMYENGVGVPQDFHLAKRHYDMALDTNSEAYLPVIMSLCKLYIRSVWHTLSGGKNGLNLWEMSNEEPAVTDKTSPKAEIDGSKTEASTPDTASSKEHIVEDDDEPWYMGKARDQFRKRQQQQQNGNGQQEEDPIQWALNRRNAERDQEDFGPEDDFDGALRTNRRIANDQDNDDNDEEFGDTLLLMLLLFAISVLVYIRTRTLERIRNLNNNPQPGQAQDLGVFPAPGDPAGEDWAILR